MVKLLRLLQGCTCCMQLVTVNAFLGNYYIYIYIYFWKFKCKNTVVPQGTGITVMSNGPSLDSCCEG